MHISGLLKTTLLDFPGHLAATVFTGGCNFRCPFCHNGDLVTGTVENPFEENDILAFLKKRAGMLEGICITGGEPTLQPDLGSFIEKVHNMGFLVKLDTNGYRPDVLRDLCQKELVDYIAMDIKSGKTGYPKTAGVPELVFSQIEKSVNFLLNGSIPYEFRTTVVKELHSASDFEEIGRWIKGCPHYFLQNFQESGQVLTPGFTPCTKEELMAFAKIVAPFVQEVSLRGIDY